MNKIVSALLAIGFLFLFGTAEAAGPRNSIRAGLMLNPIGYVSMVEYEHLIAGKVSLGGRVGVLSYDYDDGGYEEEGDGSGADFIIRIYRSGAGFNGFYYGFAAGIWQIDWEWREDFFTPAGVWISGNTTALNLAARVGWKIPLGAGDRVYIDPSITLGNYFSLDSETDDPWKGTQYDDQNDELGVYIAGGVVVGVNF
ncbi:MAG: hypothetical protein OEZ68_07490 [Gammaproteobacteria bacterium]|nr:hypothetical protein [Gammaproteobacteria bacterium]MDH5800627.1 hypothetical protein [Gammaproteobacteria bacterium]